MKLKYNFIGLLIVISFSSRSLTSCGYKSDDTMAKELLNNLTSAIVNKNVELVGSLFAPCVIIGIDDFNKKTKALLTYVTGELVSEKYEGTGAEYIIDNAKQQRLLTVGNELITTEYKFYFTILYCCIDDFDSNNVGIWNLMVQKCNVTEDHLFQYSSYEEWKNGNQYRGITII